MHFKKTIAQFVGAGAIMVLASGSAYANALVNHSFEDPDTGGAPPEYFGATGWSDFGGGTFTIEDFVAGIAAHDGNQVLKTFGQSGVFQETAASAGDVVDGTAWGMNGSYDPMGDHQVVAANLEWFDALDNQIVISFGASFDGTTAQDVWNPIGVVGAVAPAGTAKVRLTLITGCFAGDQTLCGGAPLFDDASLTVTPGVIPVPAAVWLFGSGLLGLVGVARRKA